MMDLLSAIAVGWLVRVPCLFFNVRADEVMLLSLTVFSMILLSPGCIYVCIYMHTRVVRIRIVHAGFMRVP